METSEFIRQLEENKYKNVNVVRLERSEKNGCRGGIFGIKHIACGHSDEVILRHGVSKTLLDDCVNGYCKTCRRAIDKAVDFAKKYIECLYVEAVSVAGKDKLQVMARKSYLDIFRSEVNLYKFAEKHFNESEKEYMRLLDMYVAQNIAAERYECGKRTKICKVDELKNRLTHFRSFYRMSRKELSELTGISFKTIENYELGRTKLSSISIDNAIRIADVLDVRTEFFV